MTKSVLLGAGSGAAIGGLTGKALSEDEAGNGVTFGAITGAIVGGLTGHLIKQKLDKRDQQVRRETLFNLEKFDVSTPQGRAFSQGSYHGLTAPKIETEWVPTRVEGKKLVEGHKVWIITDEAQWIPGEEIELKKSTKTRGKR